MRGPAERAGQHVREGLGERRAGLGEPAFVAPEPPKSAAAAPHARGGWSPDDVPAIEQRRDKGFGVRRTKGHGPAPGKKAARDLPEDQEFVLRVVPDFNGFRVHDFSARGAGS